MAENLDKDLRQNVDIHFETNAEEVAKKTDKVAESTEKSVEAQKQQNEQLKGINEKLEQTAKGVKTAEENTGKLTKGFKGAGLALKAMGIGLALEAFAILKDLFSSNQRVADIFGTSLKSLGIMFNDFVRFIEKSVGPVAQWFKELFENPSEKIKEMGEAIKKNLEERFDSFLKTLGHVGKAIAKLFKGDFSGAAEEAGNALKETVDVITGVNNSVDKLSDAVGGYVKEVWETADAMQQLENRTKIAIAQNQGLIEQYDRMAEQQRQIRDDETLSIEERIKANNKLGEVLDEQRKRMLANADLIIQSAALNYQQNQSIENQVALIEAQNEKKAILAQIEGFASEQKVNQIALEKELNELNQTAIDGLASREIANKKFTNSLIKDNTDRLESQRKTLDEEYNIELKRLEDKRSLYKEGTQAYADANEEILNLQNQYAQNVQTNERELTETLLSEQQMKNQAIIDNERLLFETRLTALAEQEALLREQEFASEEERNIALQALSDKRLQIERAELEQKQAIQDSQLDLAANAVGTAKMLFEKNKGVQRAALIAENAIGLAGVGISTARGIAKAMEKGAAGVPEAVVVGASGALSAINIIAATAKGLKALGGGGSAGSATSQQSPARGTAPQVGFQSSTENQIANTITQSQQELPPIQTYVVSQEVTNNQQIDRNRIASNSF